MAVAVAVAVVLATTATATGSCGFGGLVVSVVVSECSERW